jgi:indole-3-glycerol phosphate synthase
MILDKLVESTKYGLENKKNNFPLEDLVSKLNSKLSNDSHNNHNHNENYNENENENWTNFEEALKTKGISFICEIKKASPSKGVICEDFDPVKIAKDYENAGASAISVLTEEEFFKGNDKYLSEVASAVNLPILRKDFIIDEYMIYEAKLLGASAVLLIVSILDKEDLKNFIDLAYKLEMCPLVEVHTKEELKIAINSGARVIGANNRNLKDFTVDIHNSLNLKKYLEKYSQKNISHNHEDEIIFVSESGIKNPEDIKVLDDNKVNAVLIGESLMKSNNKKLAIDTLKSLI